MSIFGFSAFRYSTNWTYKTSREKSFSLVGTVAKGKLILENKPEGKELYLDYTYIAASLSKGLPFGVNKSSFDDPSTGVGEVATDKYFPDFCFPCGGWLLSMGGTGGALFGYSDPQNGIAMNMFLFGNKPFAGLRCYGQSWSTTPGVGIGAGYVRYVESDSPD